MEGLVKIVIIKQVGVGVKDRKARGHERHEGTLGKKTRKTRGQVKHGGT